MHVILESGDSFFQVIGANDHNELSLSLSREARPIASGRYVAVALDKSFSTAFLFSLTPCLSHLLEPWSERMKRPARILFTLVRTIIELLEEPPCRACRSGNATVNPEIAPPASIQGKNLMYIYIAYKISRDRRYDCV